MAAPHISLHNALVHPLRIYHHMQERSRCNVSCARSFDVGRGVCAQGLGVKCLVQCSWLVHILCCIGITSRTPPPLV